MVIVQNSFPCQGLCISCPPPFLEHPWPRFHLRASYFSGLIKRPLCRAAFTPAKFGLILPPSVSLINDLIFFPALISTRN